MFQPLSALYEEERATSQQFRGIEAFISSQARRKQVEYWLNQGILQTADDYYHAAYFFQHGEQLEHWAQAHLLARMAADLGHSQARYQAAAAYDRWLMRQGKPQKYGTNSTRSGVWRYDPTTTDEERARWDVPPFHELLDRFDRMMSDIITHAVPEGLITSAEVLGQHIDIIEVSRDPPYLPEYSVPSYDPVNTLPQQPYEFPHNVSFWQIDGLYCAKNGEGDIQCSWHLCRWQSHPLDVSNEQEWTASKLIGVPQWMSKEDVYWHRLGIAIDTTKCWIVGGTLNREALQALATNLL